MIPVTGSRISPLALPLWLPLFIVFTVLFTTVATVSSFADTLTNIDIHGFMSQGFLLSNKNNFLAKSEKGSFHFNELGINFSTAVTNKLRVGIQFAARDLGSTGNDRVRVDWAMADYRWRDWLGLRVGKLKLPIGFYSKTRDIDMLRTFILLPQGIYGETFRDTSDSFKGMSLYGEVSLGSLGDMSYQILGGSMDIHKDSSTTKAVEAWSPIKLERYALDNLYCLTATWYPPLEGLRIAFHHGGTGLEMFGTLAHDISVPVDFPPYSVPIAQRGVPMSTDLTDYQQTIFSLEYSMNELVVAVEYGTQDQTLITTIQGLEPMERQNDFSMYYGSLTYRFNRWLETGFYYSFFYRNRNDKDGTKTPYSPTYSAYQKDFCLCFRFDMNTQWVFKIEGHMMDGTALCFEADNLDMDGIPRFDRKWFLMAAKMTFSF